MGSMDTPSSESLPPFTTGVYLDFLSEGSMLEWRSKAFTRAKIFRLLRQLISTCGWIPTLPNSRTWATHEALNGNIIAGWWCTYIHWKMGKSVTIITNRWENKTCSKPPTRLTHGCLNGKSSVNGCIDGNAIYKWRFLLACIGTKTSVTGDASKFHSYVWLPGDRVARKVWFLASWLLSWEYGCLWLECKVIDVELFWVMCSEIIAALTCFDSPSIYVICPVWLTEWVSISFMWCLP